MNRPVPADLEFAKETMAEQASDTINQGLRVKTTFKLALETYAVNSCKGDTVSEELVSVKEESLSILQEFITKHNVPNDVPDELAESSSEDAGEVLEKPQVKLKKSKLT
ncbi:unnamed protein product [Dovyalis caffra]|uniref:Uncharacterized protein n=1 Tax=Dovyalis caffra TaxID=77055 RepID=A0AAV1SDA1_9ROSI|nr:unnamed protein product [Dovyalis caffra]